MVTSNLNFYFDNTTVSLTTTNLIPCFRLTIHTHTKFHYNLIIPFMAMTKVVQLQNMGHKLLYIKYSNILLKIATSKNVEQTWEATLLNMVNRI